MTGSDHRLRFAYSTINWGATCDIPQALADIRNAGWQAVELFGHSLDLLGTPSLLEVHLGGLVPATLFAGIELPDSDLQRTKLRNQIRFASEIGARDVRAGRRRAASLASPDAATSTPRWRRSARISPSTARMLV